ncbi:MAG: sugar ABC transporter permease [Spirochaetaceae bacterium]|nr:MAG: sugar ABC transporter permease [Spirochaetaceae bacterium]
MRTSGSGTLDDLFKYLALVPLIAILVVLVIAPVGQLIVTSFSRVRFASGAVVFSPVGLENYRNALQDQVALRALLNTTALAVISVTIETLLAVILAISVGYVHRGNLLFRTVFIFPMLLPPIAIGVMWLMILDFNYGVLNAVLAALGVNGPAWLAHPRLAFPSIIVVDIWHWTSFVFLIVLAGVETLPHELSESARIDGASERQIVWQIILPLLRPIILVAVITRTIFAFKVYEQIFLLTDGGPGNRTEVISSYIMRVFFNQNRMGYAAALSVLTLIFITVLVIGFMYLQSLLTREREARS